MVILERAESIQLWGHWLDHYVKWYNYKYSLLGEPVGVAVTATRD
jgi:hypothetical protein